MAFHIVTSRCFLACEKVISVVLERFNKEVESMPMKLKSGKPRKGKAKKKPEKTKIEQYCIVIAYYPLSATAKSNNNYNNGTSEPEGLLELRVDGKQKATELYAEI